MIENPNVLLSIVNTKLRDFYSSLDELCDDLDYDKERVIEILGSIDYYYKRREGSLMNYKLNYIENLTDQVNKNTAN